MFGLESHEPKWGVGDSNRNFLHVLLYHFNVAGFAENDDVSQPHQLHFAEHDCHAAWRPVL